MTILITGAWQCSQDELDSIRNMGHRVYFLQYEKDPLPLPYEAVEAVVCNGLFQHHPIERFQNLRYIQLTSAGYDRVPMEYVERKGIAIHNARGVYSIPMAEFALSGVLQLYKQSRFFQENQKQHKWEKHRGLLELHGKTVCIVGCGSVGTECAKRFKAFGCKVMGVDLYPREDGSYAQMHALHSLDSCLEKADVVVLTLPLTKETYHLMDASRFARMKKGAVLVNIARGAVVDTVAMEKALSDRLGGAVLDVFEEEPLAEDSPLWELDNVIITPHNSFVGEQNTQRLNNIIQRNLSCIQCVIE